MWHKKREISLNLLEVVSSLTSIIWSAKMCDKHLCIYLLISISLNLFRYAVDSWFNRLQSQHFDVMPCKRERPTRLTLTKEFLETRFLLSYHRTALRLFNASYHRDWRAQERKSCERGSLMTESQLFFRFRTVLFTFVILNKARIAKVAM